MMKLFIVKLEELLAIEEEGNKKLLRQEGLLEEVYNINRGK